MTIPHVFKQLEQTGRLKNFELASPQGQGDFCSNYPFDDSDVYKAIEAASYSLMLHPDPELVKYLDKVISKIAAARRRMVISIQPGLLQIRIILIRIG